MADTPVFLFIFTITLPAEEGKPAQNKVVNALSDTLDNAITKVRTANPGCDIKQALKQTQIDLP